MSGPLWRVVVVDDRKRFALHVARFVLRRLAIGERRSLADGSAERGGLAGPADGRFSWLASHGVVAADDGRGSFVWIDGRQARAEDLARHAAWLRQGGAAEPARRMIVLLDRRQELTRERALEVFRAEGLDGRVEIEVWSAYHASDEGASPIYSKSGANLKRLRGKLDEIERALPRPPADGPSPVKHVLITGAGFEIADGEGGFGLPPTAQLLHDLDEPFVIAGDGGPEDGSTLLLTAAEGGFPCWYEGEPPRRREPVESLDDFWNLLLTVETQRVVRRLGTGIKGRAGAFQYEMRMRQAFRRVLSRHDWGHLKQAVLAARLDWLCWLTTNYTGFSDRATDLSLKRWHVIATEVEAVNLIHEEPWTAEAPDRYLFKLHGELRHLHSMAIAGWDKEPFSPLWFPVEKLSQIYTAAERFLEGCLRPAEGQEAILLHMVGHGLKDERLVRLIAHAIGRAEAKKMRCHVVLVGLGDSPSNMRQSLRPAKLEEDQVTEVGTTAVRYLSRLHRDGLDGAESVTGWRKWLAGFKEEER